MGGIDTDWASFSEAIERLMTFVRNKDGIESVIKNLDGKLSEAIMHAMTNGPELQKKVSQESKRIHRRRCRYLSLSLLFTFYIIFSSMMLYIGTGRRAWLPNL